MARMHGKGRALAALALGLALAAGGTYAALSAMSAPAPAGAEAVASGRCLDHSWELSPRGALAIRADGGDPAGAEMGWEEHAGRIAYVRVEGDVEVPAGFGGALAGAPGLLRVDLARAGAAGAARVIATLPEDFDVARLDVPAAFSKRALALLKESTERTWTDDGDGRLRRATVEEKMDMAEEDDRLYNVGAAAGGADGARDDGEDADAPGGAQGARGGAGEEAPGEGASDGGADDGGGASGGGAVSDSVLADAAGDEAAAAAAGAAARPAALDLASADRAADAARAAGAGKAVGREAAARLAAKSIRAEYDLKRSGIPNVASTVNFDEAGKLRVKDAAFDTNDRKAFEVTKYKYATDSIDGKLDGVSATFSKVSKSDWFTLTWRDVGWDSAGDRVDFTLKVEGITWNVDPDHDTGHGHVIGNEPGSDKLWVYSFDPTYNSKLGMKCTISGAITKRGGGGKASGRYVMIVDDLDQPSRVPGSEKSTPMGAWAEQVELESGYADTSHLAPKSRLDKTSAEKGKYWNGTDDTTTDNGLLCSFANELDASFSFSWAGSKCGTALMSQISPHRVFKSTDAHGYISERQWPASGDYFDIVKHEGSVKYSGITADEGYYVRDVVVDGGTYVGPVSSWTFSGVVSDHAIEVVTAPIEPAALSFAARKELSGRELSDRQFSFRAVEVDARGEPAAGGAEMTAQNDLNGRVAFSGVTYTWRDAGKAFRYEVTEENDGQAGYSYDAAALFYDVEVSLGADGKLSARGSWEGGRDTFSNSYSASGSFTVRARKALSGRALRAGEFSFELSDGAGRAVATARNDADGNVAFPAIEVGAQDAGATLNYQVREVKGALKGVTYDTRAVAVAVAVSDNGDGTLSCTPRYYQDAPGRPDGPALFSNSYSASGQARIEASKRLSGAEGTALSPAGYSFTLLDENGAVLARTESAADGSVLFARSYAAADAGKTFRYRVREDAPAEPVAGMSYDSHVLDVSVAVSDNGDGTLSAPASYSGSREFVNAYAQRGGLRVRKTDEAGAPLSGATFGVYDAEGTPVATAVSGADGWAATGSRDLALGDYTVRELAAPAGYDAHVGWSAGCRVERDGEVATCDRACADAAGSTTVTVRARKELSGRALSAGQFSFTLLDGDGKAVSTARNDAAGDVVFEPIAYKTADIGKTFSYTVAEDAAAFPGYSYDAHVGRAEVRVSADGAGKPVAELSSSGMEFSNSYAARGSAAIDGVVRLEGRALSEGEFSFTLYGEDGAALATRACGLSGPDGPFSFPELTYTAVDVGRHVYTVAQECGADADGLAFDRHVETVCVDVSDNGDGTLSCEVSYDASGDLFVNVYTARGSAPAAFRKELSGRELSAGEFSFELSDGAGRVVATARNDAEGNVDFGELSFTAADDGRTYDYAAREVAGAEADMSYDASRPVFRVSCSDDGRGHVDCEVSYPSGNTFSNRYTAHGGVRALKLDADGAPLAGARIGAWRAGQPTTAAPAAVMVSGADGVARTSTRALCAGDYYLHEIAAPAGYTADASWAPSFSVTADDEVADLTAQPCVDAPKTGDATISAVKVLKGAELAAGQFSFQLLDSGHAVVQEKACDEHGRAVFDALPFTKDDIGKTFSYTLREAVPAPAAQEGGMDYDEHAEAVTVRVSEAAGALAVEVVYDDWRSREVSDPGEFSWSPSKGASPGLYYVVAADGSVPYGNMGSRDQAERVVEALELSGRDMSGARVVAGSELLDAAFALDAGADVDLGAHYLVDAETSEPLYGPFDSREAAEALRLASADGASMRAAEGFSAVYDIEATKLYYSKAAYEDGTYDKGTGSAWGDRAALAADASDPTSPSAGLFDFAYYMAGLAGTGEYGYAMEAEARPDLVLVRRDGTKESVAATMAAAFSDPAGGADVDASVTFSKPELVSGLFIEDDDASKLTDGRYAYNGSPRRQAAWTWSGTARTRAGTRRCRATWRAAGPARS